MGFIEYLKMTLSTMLTADDMFFGSSGKYKVIRGASYAFSLLFYFQGIFNSFEISQTLHRVTKHLTERVNKISIFLHESIELISKHWHEEMGTIFGVAEGILKPMKEEITYIQSMISKPYSLFTNFGKQLHSYKTLSKDIIKSVLYKIYILDCITLS